MARGFGALVKEFAANAGLTRARFQQGSPC